MKEKEKTTFEKELASLLNRYSKENVSNTPDFILVNYLVSCLQAFEVATNTRESWYGYALMPGQVRAL